MADLIHEAHATVDRLEKDPERQLTPTEQLLAAQVKVLLSIAEVLRAPRIV